MKAKNSFYCRVYARARTVLHNETDIRPYWGAHRYALVHRRFVRQARLAYGYWEKLLPRTTLRHRLPIDGCR